MEGRKIRVLVVDDSMFFRLSMVRALNAADGIEVIAEAYDPYEARDRIEEFMPDVMTLDVEMPYMNGVEFMKILLPQCAIPVIIVTSLAQAEGEARRAGAADFLLKPQSRTPDAVSAFSAELVRRVRAAVGVRSAPSRGGGMPGRTLSDSSFAGIIAIGASTGGTQATAKILKALPADMPGIVVVQHMPPDFTRMYAENLDRECAMSVREARDGDTIEKGQVLIAPGGDLHMEAAKRGGGYCVRLTAGGKVNGHCPSVDVIFRSLARVVPGRDLAGVLLTGMGADGARGLLEMHQKGAYTIGQDEKSCVVYGMPKEAYDMGALTRQAALDNIAALLIGFVRDGRR